jgi:hypothetical protein
MSMSKDNVDEGVLKAIGELSSGQRDVKVEVQSIASHMATDIAKIEATFPTFVLHGLAKMDGSSISLTACGVQYLIILAAANQQVDTFASFTW